ncbi:hypothetical protein HER10_EVM0000272 [Colletotrichum scovillei]|uniref:uncharacterized protein n=1 Tax=Colletotrichum scovillei TaxID=1209932 RepID=UPI0015C3DEBB|nr:uncharacterized protein HER10_EVM0000272 [Colletotrichum scovillei]KAF4784897.1 hypothetical protein HER10_EVM0000272 [Colletotrichum scovillei]
MEQECSGIAALVAHAAFTAGRRATLTKHALRLGRLLVDRPANQREKRRKQDFSLVSGARFDIRMDVSSNPNMTGHVDGEGIRLIRADKPQRVRIGWERLKQSRGGGRSVTEEASD